MYTDFELELIDIVEIHGAEQARLWLVHKKGIAPLEALKLLDELKNPKQPLFTLNKDIPTDKQRAEMIKELCWRSFKKGAKIPNNCTDDRWIEQQKKLFVEYWYTENDPNRIHT